MLHGEPTAGQGRIDFPTVARVVVDVMPKPEILDPQGKAVTGALRRLGFAGVSVRQGKRFELELEGELDDDRLAEVRRAAETLLANTVIETFDVRVEAAQRSSEEVIERGGRAGAGGLMPARIGVVTFPGSLDDHDALRAVRLSGAEPISLWHASDSLDGVDAVILPGGFSYGDYLRCGAISRFAPVMGEVVSAAAGGLPVLGICNGFQILCEAHLLPGALTRNDVRTFVCKDQDLRVESVDTVWTRDFRAGDVITIVIKNGEGAYIADDETLRRLENQGQVVFRYVGGNPNGSLNDIAGICNERGNVVGLMPHPEHNVDPLTGPSIDGRRFFSSVLGFLAARV